MDFYDYLSQNFSVSPKIISLARSAEKRLAPQFRQVDEISGINQLKVLSAMQKHGLSEAHFAATTGYGYNDAGRDALEAIYATVFGAEDALVRPQMISGTHALTVALFGSLRHGDELLSPVGKPYDTLDTVIGIRPLIESRGSLAEHGVTYRQVDFLPDGTPDFDGIEKAVTPKTKMALIQRSKGYAWRKSLSVDEIGRIIARIKAVKPDVICAVDNCYGEFVEETEPSEPTGAGADLVVGSLIKNPGGGLAQVGGYIAGKREYVENAAFRLTSPGLGKEVGPTLGALPRMLQGLFLAPQVVGGCVRGAMFLSAVMDELGFDTMPGPGERRADIVQAVSLKTPENVLAFCRGIQKAAPVDSAAVPEPWPMPGYDCPVVMAAGAFVQGSSIELSADAPMRPPYTVYFQGGLTWRHAQAGVIIAVNEMMNEK
ncbi:MAG: methionine gamma-lyase family protein [Defluviitaleaceae bacterium]|nr:methionine gamma-lyase family protein [Defluviitaleaceae bacterium]